MPTWRQVDMAAARLCVTSGGTVGRVCAGPVNSHGGGRAGSVSARAASAGCSGCDRLARRARALAARGAEHSREGLRSHSPPPLGHNNVCTCSPCAISAEARSRCSGATARTLMIGGCAYARAFPAVRLWWVEGEGALWDFVQQQSALHFLTLGRRRKHKKVMPPSQLGEGDKV